MAGINHEAIKTHGDKGLHTEWNADHKQKGNHDCEKYQHLNHVWENRTDWPAGPVVGQVVYRTDFNNFFGWNGTMWISLSPVATIVVAADGTGNFTDIQDGIDALPATGGVVYIKEGTYTINAMIHLNKPNSALIGAGKSTIIQTVGNIPAIRISNANCIIDKMNIKGSGAGLANYGIEIRANNTTIENVYIENCFDGIYADSHSNIIIRGNFIFDNLNDGIVLVTIVGDNDKNIIISNAIYSNDGAGVGLTTATNMIISNNHIYNNEEHGITLTSSNWNLLSNNIITDNDFSDTATFDGINLNETDDNNIITGNICEGNDRYQINIANANCDNNIVAVNRCDDTGAVGNINDVGTGTLLGLNKET